MNYRKLLLTSLTLTLLLWTSYWYDKYDLIEEIAEHSIGCEWITSERYGEYEAKLFQKCNWTYKTILIDIDDLKRGRYSTTKEEKQKVFLLTWQLLFND